MRAHAPLPGRPGPRYITPPPRSSAAGPDPHHTTTPPSGPPASLPSPAMALLAAARAAPRASAVSAALRSLSTSAAAAQVSKVTVFGAGLMGSGIGQVLAQNGFQVTIADTSDAALQKGRSIVEASAKRIAKKKLPEAEQGPWAKQIADSITWTTDSKPSVSQTDLVIEAIVENIDIKRKLFTFLDETAPPEAILTSNTSSLSITDIARDVKRKDKFAGFHAFNPVPQMKLVEVIRTSSTSEDTFSELLDVAKRMGKSPAACKDTPGYVQISDYISACPLLFLLVAKLAG